MFLLIRVLKLNCCDHLNDESIDLLLGGCTQLEALRLRTSNFFTENVFTTLEHRLCIPDPALPQEEFERRSRLRLQNFKLLELEPSYSHTRHGVQLFIEKFTRHYNLEENDATNNGTLANMGRMVRANSNDIGQRTIAGVNNLARRAFDAVFLAGLGDRPLPFQRNNGGANNNQNDFAAPMPAQAQGGLFGAAVPNYRRAGAAEGTTAQVSNSANESGEVLPPVIVILQDKFAELELRAKHCYDVSGSISNGV